MMTRIILISIVLLFGLIYYKLLLGQDIFTHDSILWYGRFHYFVKNIANGYFPFWDPYIIAGVPFYPNISFADLLAPLVLPFILLNKFSDQNMVLSFTYFYLSELLLFVIGSFYLFRHITNCRTSAIVSAGLVLFSIAPPFFRQSGTISIAFLTPFALYFLLLFFENMNNAKRHLYFSCFVLVSGISMNVFIPAYFLFNLAAFLIVIFALRIVNIGDVIKAFYNKRFLAFIFLSFFALLLMIGPLLALYKDSKGEIFPDVRILQKTGNIYKKMVASDIGDGVLSSKFTKEQGVYSSYGNIINLIYPDMYKSYFGRPDFFKQNDYISEIFQYMGIIPFMFCIVGFIYGKSRFKYAALMMVILISINMFSFFGVHGRLPNLLQRFFNAIFPPLKMVEVRETLWSFLLLYMGILSSLGLKLIFDKEGFYDFIKKRHLIIIIISAIILSAKFIITAIFFRMPFYISYIDLSAIIMLLVFSGLVYICAKGFVRQRLFYGLLLILVFTDIAIYNIDIKKYALQKNTLSLFLSKYADESSEKQFNIFREPFLDVGLAFGETIFKVKGALAGTGGYQYHMFTTKRYYDLLTNVPLENQFAISGIVYPIVRFFPVDVVRIAENKKDVLDYLTNANIDELGKYLMIEKGGKEGAVFADSKGFKTLDEFENAPWLSKENIIRAYANFIKKEHAKIIKIKEDINKFGINTPEAKFGFKEFSPNVLALSVRNTTDGYLYYNDGWSKYWRAYNNEKEMPIYIANYNFKAIYLPKGEHIIRFVYEPWHYKLGLLSYITGVLFSLTLVIYCYIKKRA